MGAGIVRSNDIGAGTIRLKLIAAGTDISNIIGAAEVNDNCRGDGVVRLRDSCLIRDLTIYPLPVWVAVLAVAIRALAVCVVLKVF